MDMLPIGLPAVGFEFDGEYGTVYFIRVCPKCHRFVKTPQKAKVVYNGFGDISKVECIAECKRCGEVKLDCEGWF